MLRCSDLLSLIPLGGNVAEGSVLPGDLRLLGRAAAAAGGHPGSGPLLGLYESQPAPAELLLELLEQPSAGPGFRKVAAERNCQKKAKLEYLLIFSPAPGWCSLHLLVFVCAEPGTALSIHVCR